MVLFQNYYKVTRAGCQITHNGSRMERSMKDYAISYMDEFGCLGADCPQTCCKGWQILVDEQTLAVIQQEEAPLARKMRGKIRRRGQTQIRKRLGRCPFHTKERLCQLQKEGHTQWMPLVCREYPRRIVAFSDRRELTLELACPAAAELFLQHTNQIFLSPWVGSAHDTLWQIQNEDAPFLSFLLQLRDETIAQINQVERIDAAWMGQCYQRYDAMHTWIVRDRLQEAQNLLESMNEEMTVTSGRGTDAELSFAFYPMELLDRVIAYQLDDSGLRYTNGLLKQRIRSYYRLFNEKTPEQARRFFDAQMKQMLTDMPSAMEKYKAYAIYNLYVMLPAVYEDYHLLRALLLGDMYLQLYMLFDVVTWVTCQQEGSSYTLDKQVETLSALERRMRHNLGITDGIWRRLRKEFLS